MQPDDFWISRFHDNRVRGILKDLRDAIEDSDNPDILHKLVSSLHLGMSNYAAKRERELRRNA